MPPIRYLDRTTPPHITTLVLMTAVGSVCINLFLPSLPVMAEEFGTSYAIMQFAVTGYLALSGFVQLGIGPVSDRFGRRPVMIGALILFTLAGIGAATAETLTGFFIFRMLQASSVVGFVVSRAAIRDMVGREQAASMIGYVTMGMAMAPMIAPTVGGMLGDAFGWRSNFHALALVGAVVLVICWFDQGETNHQRSGSFREQAQAYPALLRSRRFWGYAMTMMFAAGTFFAFLGGAPFVGSVVYGLSATEVGMYLAITPLGYATGNGLSGRFSVRVGLYRMMTTGALITLFGMLLALLVVSAGVQHPLGFFLFTFTIGLGRMRACHILVQLDPQPRRIRHDDIAILPLHRRLENLRMDELPMRPEQQVGARAHRLADRAAKRFGQCQRLQIRLSPVIDGIRPRRIELHRRKPLRHRLRRPLGAGIGVGVENRRVFIRFGVQIGVAAQPLMHPPAQQLVHRLIQRLAHDIPAGHFQPRNHPHHRQVRPVREPRAIAAMPQRLGIERAGSLDKAGKSIGHHRLDHARTKGRRIDLAIANHTTGGRQLDEDEIAPAKTGGRIADDEGFERGNLHGALPGIMVEKQDKIYIKYL